MSDEPTGSLGRLVQELISAAEAFLGFLDLRVFTRNSVWEIEGGQKVRKLVGSLRSLRDVRLPGQVRFGMEELERSLLPLIGRWQWDRVVGPEGEAFLSGQERLRDQNRRAFYGGVRSYVEAYYAREISQRPGANYIDLAKDAEREGIPPAAPRVLTEDALESLFRAWIHAPYLGPEFPGLEYGEYTAIKTAIQDLREGMREPTALQPALVEANREAERELMLARLHDPLPSPDRITVGEMIDALRVQAVIYPIMGTSKNVFEQWNRREELLGASPGFRELKSWVERTHGQRISFEIAEDFRSRLARHLKRDFDEVNALDLRDAVHQLLTAAQRRSSCLQ